MEIFHYETNLIMYDYFSPSAAISILAAKNNVQLFFPEAMEILLVVSDFGELIRTIIPIHKNKRFLRKIGSLGSQVFLQVVPYQSHGKVIVPPILIFC